MCIKRQQLALSKKLCHGNFWVVNDLLQASPECVLKWTVCDDNDNKVTEGSKNIDVGIDSATRVCDLSFTLEANKHYNVIFQLEDASGKVLARNTYKDAFGHPPHPEGIPIDWTRSLECVSSV